MALMVIIGWMPVTEYLLIGVFLSSSPPGESSADAIDWSTARVMEKLDGSLATLYWYKGEWHVSSSGVPDASSEYAAGSKHSRPHLLASSADLEPCHLHDPSH